MNPFDLSGKTALVTGCKRGIGFAMAEGLAEAGADIIGVSASLEPGSAIENAVTALGRKFTAYQCDFSDRAAVTAGGEFQQGDEQQHQHDRPNPRPRPNGRLCGRAGRWP